MKKIIILLTLIIISACAASPAKKVQSGDIIFQTSRSTQSTAIQLATHSKFSHVGLILMKGGKPYVFEAVFPVKWTPLNSWIRRGVGRKCVIRRLRDSEKILTPQVIHQMEEVAKSLQGKPYDLYFEWSDERIYCSELVWKIYEKAAGIQLGQMQKLKEFDLSSDAVKSKMRERYGSKIPMDESVISPVAIYDDARLLTIYQN